MTQSKDAKQKPWYKQRTTWTGVISSIGAVLGLKLGMITYVEALEIIQIGLTGIFLREAVKTKN